MPNIHRFPQSDKEFSPFVKTAISYLLAQAARLGVSAGNVTIINDLQKSWVDNETQYNDPAQRTSVVTASKADLHTQIVAALQTIYDDIPKSALTLTDRETLHIHDHAGHSARTEVMKTAPEMTLKSTTHLQHTLHFSNPETPGSNALPDGQRIVVESFAGAKGLDAGAISFANAKNSTRAELVIHFEEAQSGQTCYYRCCYESTHNERSAWSAVLDAVVS